MPEENSNLDQGPRRDGPAHRADNPKVDTPSRRRVLQGLLGVAGGAFGVGTPAFAVGIAKGEEDGYERAQEGQKVFVQMKEGKPTGITEAEIINTPHQQVLNRESSVAVEPSVEVPALFTDVDTDVTVVKGLTNDEITASLKSDTPPKKTLTVLTGAKPEQDEETAVYEVVLPTGEDKASVYFNLSDNDTVHVILRTGAPVKCGLSLDEKVKQQNEDSPPYKFGVTSDNPFPPGASVYVVINTRIPPQATLTV